MTSDQLQSIMKDAPQSRIAEFFQPLVDAMNVAQINTPLRQAHFLAQIAQESGQLRYTEEIASGAAYEGRKDLGNTQPGDGVRFKGRGLIQVTGRANYATFGRSIDAVLTVNNAWVQVADLPLCVQSATWYWTRHSLNVLADADNVLAITKVINGGTNGLAGREAFLAAAKTAFGI